MLLFVGWVLLTATPGASAGWLSKALGRDKEQEQLAPVGSDEIQSYFAAGDLTGLHHALNDYFWRTARAPGSLEGKFPLREALTAKGAGSTYSSAYKLDHDIEQLEYLNISLAARFRRVRQRVPALDQLERTGGLYGFRPQDLGDIGEFYNRALNVPDPKPVAKILGKGFADPKKVESAYLASSPSIVVVDDALSTEGFDQLRMLLLESTVFFETKMPTKFGGYVGAIVEDGLHARPFLALADALRKACPEMLKDRPLAYLWAYKYDAELASGINVHADEAAVNVNLWLTPDDANLDSTNGGLVVYTARPDVSATISDYNQRGEEFSRKLLEETNYANITVPYKANRAVIFDSALYHKTDDFKFKRGYENRRINLTLLFGTMSKAPLPAGGDPKGRSPEL